MDHDISGLDRKKARKRKNQDPALNISQKIQTVDDFLKSAEMIPISRTDKTIFVTLSDVSSDESECEIVGESKKNQISHQSFNVIDNKQKFATFLNSLDFLINPPLCIIKQSQDYLCLNSVEKHCYSSSSDSSSDSSQNDNKHIPITLDNGECFIIDEESEPKNTKNKITDEGSLEKTKHKRKRKSQKRFPDNPDLRAEPRMFKYWSQRYDLFERFDMGIKLDRESWFSVTPEYVAKEHAELCNEDDVVLDGFCGAGGNLIQFAYRCKKVYGLDIDSSKVSLAEHNCQVYGIEAAKVTVMNEDYYKFCALYMEATGGCGVVVRPDISVVFLSPPWGGQDYIGGGDSTPVFDLKSMGMAGMMASARMLKPRLIVVYLPRNTDITHLHQYALATDTVDILKHGSRYKSAGTKKVKAVTAVYRLK